MVVSHIGTQFCTLKKEQDPKAEHVLLKTRSGVSYGMTFFSRSGSSSKGRDNEVEENYQPIAVSSLLSYVTCL